MILPDSHPRMNIGKATIYKADPSNSLALVGWGGRRSRGGAIIVPPAGCFRSGEGAVVRSYGRKGGSNRILSTPFDSLETAWPFIRRTIKARLRHGYQVVEVKVGS